MHVHVALRVDVIQAQAGRRKPLELRANLGLELLANARMEEELEAGGNEIRLELAAFVDEIGNVRRPAAPAGR